MFYALAVLCLAGSGLAQVISFGACPKVTVQPNFNTSRYAGRWHEQARFFALFELNTRCVSFDYFLTEDPQLVNSVPSFISGFTGKPQVYHREIYVPDINEPAKWKVDIPLALSGKNNMWVLGTDYENYALVYSCDQYGGINLKYAWLLTREQNPDESVVAKAYEVVENNNLKKRNFWKTSQENCEAKDTL